MDKNRSYSNNHSFDAFLHALHVNDCLWPKTKTANSNLGWVACASTVTIHPPCYDQSAGCKQVELFVAEKRNGEQ